MKLTTFGEAILVARRRKGLAQWELAEKAGVHQSTISHYESQGVIPQLDCAKKLCEVLDIDPFTYEIKEPQL